MVCSEDGQPPPLGAHPDAVGMTLRMSTPHTTLFDTDHLKARIFFTCGALNSVAMNSSTVHCGDLGRIFPPK